MEFVSKTLKKFKFSERAKKRYTWFLHILMAFLVIFLIGLYTDFKPFVDSLDEMFVFVAFFALPILTTILVISKYVQKQYTWFLHIALFFLILTVGVYINVQLTKDEQEGLAVIAGPMMWMMTSAGALGFYVLSVLFGMYKQKKLDRKK